MCEVRVYDSPARDFVGSKREMSPNGPHHRLLVHLSVFHNSGGPHPRTSCPSNFDSMIPLSLPFQQDVLRVIALNESTNAHNTSAELIRTWRRLLLTGRSRNVVSFHEDHRHRTSGCSLVCVHRSLSCLLCRKPRLLAESSSVLSVNGSSRRRNRSLLGKMGTAVLVNTHAVSECHCSGFLRAPSRPIRLRRSHNAAPS